MSDRLLYSLSSTAKPLIVITQADLINNLEASEIF